VSFVLEIESFSTQSYIKNYIINIIREFNINADVTQKDEKIISIFSSNDEKLQKCLEAIAQNLPASYFLKNSKNYEIQNEINSLPSYEQTFPLNLGLCPTCQKEMFDVSSKRYYYPFISCSCCGGNYSFFNNYPYERENTSFKFIRPCLSCENETLSVGLKENHHINSCHECGVPVRLVSKTKERYANDASSFRTMFEVVAKAIQDNKKVLIKTTMGYRLFYTTKEINFNSILLMINAAKITDHLALITEEFNALLSIERPILNVTIKNEKLKKTLNSNTVYVKYPDDGFSILLGAELQKIGVDFIAYEDVDADTKADLIMDYDLEINPQSDIRVFLNKDISFIAEGERVSFPSTMFNEKNLLSITDEYVGLPKNGVMIFDRMEHFKSVNIDRVNILDSIQETYHSKQKYFSEDEASFISVIAENDALDKKCVGAYFDEEPSFLYYDGKNVLRIVPPKYFDSSKIIQEIEDLRDGSDKLMQNLKNKMPKVYKKLQTLQEAKDIKLFEAVAIILGLDDESMRGVTKEAMKFIGKGGIQIDTHVKDNRFDHAAFLASIISYQLAGVSTTILCYSIFESFGDYFYEILQELKTKTKATQIVLCGKHFSNQSLFSRMQRNLNINPPLLNKNYPIGKENAVVGGAYL